ncbi:MAG TPA: glycine cleavage system aminomethyltransferase GcvT [Myxococcota bacterium]|nr:glycine cleavage system aminomethyltransferase GcvT [Myxococcota bacterium]
MSEHVTQSLEGVDPLIHDMSSREAERQRRKIILIASESICPASVREALASEFGNVYAEGYPSPRTFFEPPERLSSFGHQLAHYRRYSNRRYYKGCEYVDILESTLRRRTAELFANKRASADKIFVNAQPLSGAAANNAVYNAFVKPGDTVMGPSLTHGGHLTHGSEVNRSGIAHNIVPYEVSRSGKLDYDYIAKLATEHKPKLIIGGFSAYPWDVDWQKLRAAADGAGAVLLADIAHLAGMVAAGLLNNPVGIAHVVSFTTHKTLCGPRGAMLLSTDPEIARRVDMGVFPGEQGGPHIHQLAAKAVAMRIAASDEFKALQHGVLENTHALAEAFEEEGLTLAYGGTNTHMCLLDLRKVKTPNGQPLTGEIASRILDLAGIVCNKNTIHGDTNAIHPSGLRFGSTWATQRGFGPPQMKKLAALIARLIRGIHPFSYIGGRIDWGRGKIEQKLLEQISAEVSELIAEVDAPPAGELTSGYPHFPPSSKAGEAAERPTPLASLHKSQAVKVIPKDGWLVPGNYGDKGKEIDALREGAALLDAGGALLLGLGRGRPGQLLECACSTRIISLPAGRASATWLLDPDGHLLAPAMAVRLTTDEAGYDRFMLRVETRQPEEISAWLRGLSDGYLLHDEDIWIKCEGPAVIEDLSVPGEDRDPTTCLGLRGPKAAAVVEKALGISPPEQGAAVEHDELVVLNRPAGVTPGFDVFLPVPSAAAVWSRLVEAGAQPAGCQAVAEVFDREDHPGSEEVDLGKPFFVGQKARMKDAPADKPKAFEWNPPEAPPLETCLIGEHRKLTSAKHLVPFAGWLMPVMYSGILAEHEAVRNRAGLFDVAHMGLLEFRGPFAERFLDLLTSNYVPMLCPGQAHYSYLLAHDGRCIDDIIVYRLERERFIVVVNAANADEDEAWFRAVAGGGMLLDERFPRLAIEGDLTIRNLKDPACGTDCRVDLAIQGPRSLDILSAVSEPASFVEDLSRLRKFELLSGTVCGGPAIVNRTGYTGEELGYEIFVHPDKAPAVWNALLEAGSDAGIVPAGLGARDTLRTEAGFPLHGHELAGAHAINPIEAGYGSYVKLHKPFFVGRTAALDWHQNRRRTVVRYEVCEKGGKVLRPGNPVLAARRGEYAGVVTSATSTGQRQVGLALIDSKFAREGNDLFILPITDHDKAPPARTPLDLSSGDWMTIPRRASILPRFMSAGEEPLN